VPGPTEVLIEVAAAGVNRADLLQRAGQYPPPPGASPILGLEVSGVVAAVGSQVHGWVEGDAVAALLAGGGYAEQVCVPASQLHPLPAAVDLIDAAALPEAAATSWVSLMGAGGLRPGDAVLVHGGSGGVGTFAIQLAAALGARVLTTAGGPARCQRCLELGADVTEHVWPLLEAGTIHPVIHARLPLDQADRAHEMLRTGEAFGKVLLIP